MASVSFIRNQITFLINLFQGFIHISIKLKFKDINVFFGLHHCICPPGTVHKCTDRRDIPGSVIFGPAIAGLYMGSAIIQDLCTEQLKEADKEREVCRERDRKIREIARAEKNALGEKQKEANQ